MNYFVYIIKCSDNTLYTGYTTDVEKRLREHNGEGKTKTAKSVGAKYTRGRRPVTLEYSESFNTRGEALKRECIIKKLTRIEKLELIKLGNKKDMAKGQDRKKEVKKPKKDKTKK